MLSLESINLGITKMSYLNETVFFLKHLSNQKGMVNFIKSGWQKNWTGIGICERDSGKRILWKLI